MNRLGSLLLVGFATFGCLTQGMQVRSPGEGGGDWVGFHSAHFDLVSDLSQENATRVIAGLEETYTLLEGVVFGASTPPQFRTNAVVFQHDGDMKQFIGDWGGEYRPSLPNDLEPSPTVIASGTLSPFARLSFAHELTHRFNHVALGPTPSWLNEGLAQYYSTIRAEGGKPVVGQVDARYQCLASGVGDMVCYEGETLPANRLPLASDLIDLDYKAFYSSTSDRPGSSTYEQKQARTLHYGMSFLLVHMLLHEKHAYAQRFRSELAGPPSTHKGLALDAIVQNVPAEQLDRDLKAYLSKQMVWRQHHAGSAPVPKDLEQHVLSDSEVHLWWARLDAFDGPHADRARAQLEAAQKTGGDSAEPFFWWGRFSAMRGDDAGAERNYRRALTLSPGNPDYLYGLLALYWGGKNGKSWIEAARSKEVTATIAELSLGARTPRQLSAVAAHQLLSKDASAALKTAAEACRIGPDCWPCFHNHAAALFEMGDTASALAAESEALTRLPENATPFAANTVVAALGFYQRAQRDPDSVRDEPRPGLFAP